VWERIEPSKSDSDCLKEQAEGDYRKEEDVLRARTSSVYLSKRVIHNKKSILVGQSSAVAVEAQTEGLQVLPLS